MANARHITRRSALKGSAALALAATPGLASASSPDAELLALGKEFDAAWGDWFPKWRAMREKGVHFEEEMRQKMPTPFSGEVYDQIADACGYSPVMDTNNAALDLVTELSERILAMPATTIGGFAVKASALVFVAVPPAEVAIPDRDRDYHNSKLMAFADEMRALAAEGLSAEAVR